MPDDPQRLPASTDATPIPWRIAAAGMLGVGLLGGERATGAGARRATLTASGLGFVLWTIIVGASRRAARLDPAAARCPAPPPDAALLPRVDVVIPARDEVRALPALLRDLGAQDHRDPDGCPKFTVTVVDDRSTDRTSTVAVAAADRAGLGTCFRIVPRPPGARPDGKGAALAAVPASLLCGAAIVVLDADARLEPDFLRRAAAWVAVGTPALTARRRVRHADAGLLAAAQAAEQTLDGFQLRARAAVGGYGELRGNGMVVTPSALNAAGGWPAGSLTEDLDLATRLAVRGIPVAWAADLVVWEAPTATFAALGRQRLRWAEGSLRRFLALVPAVLASGSLPVVAKVDLIGYAIQLVLPPFFVGMAIGSIRRRRPVVPLVLGGVYVGVAGGLTWVALGEEATFDGRRMPARARLTRSMLGGSFAAHWLAVVPLALARIAIRTGPTTFERTRDRLL